MKKELERRIDLCKNIVDLGCGNNPLRRAKTAVDCYIEPVERSQGNGNTIDTKEMNRNGIRFINAKIDSKLPFKDKEFDYAYSHHVFEHLDNPSMACEEMMRIATAGVIITPSFLAESIFGREYHKWMVMQRDNSILFFKKRPFEDRRFGDHPIWNKVDKKWESNENTNPFDILLSDGKWYNGDEKFERLSSKIFKYFKDSDPLMEITFMWENKFEYIIYE